VISEEIKELPELPDISLTAIWRSLVSFISSIPTFSLIPDMNGRYGPKQWREMQDGASDHNTVAVMACTMVVNVLPGWPAGSQDPNPVESLWVVLKRCLEELGHKPRKS
jgi:hypothetical protein